MNEENVRVMHAIWKDCFEHSVPFIVAGDFNVAPSAMVSWAPLAKVGAITRAPSVPTYVVPGSSSYLD
eukprot:1580007-Pyramimonas_sp.AAC.1